MNIVMMTNTYLPHVGGVARSVENFVTEYRRQGHRVLVVAPDFDPKRKREQDVFRLPAIQNFNGSDFSVRLPVPVGLTDRLDEFQPDIIHSHHPFLIGDSALRVAEARSIPLVFTHHTLYERYTHYVPGDSPALQRFVIDLSTGYANLCDMVFAPSGSIADLLRQRGVRKPVHVVPTGIPAERLATGDGEAMRRRLGIPPDAFVVGHLGRLAQEKNLRFLARAVARFLRDRPDTHFMLGGGGPEREPVESIFRAAGVADRVHVTGVVTGADVADFYRALDVFGFASHTETQGLVLAEAMAAGVPVVAVAAPGVSDVVDDGLNGRLLPHDDLDAFTSALHGIAGLAPAQRAALNEGARRTAEAYTTAACGGRALELYRQVIEAKRSRAPDDHRAWQGVRRLLEAEWKLWVNRAQAAEAALSRRPL